MSRDILLIDDIDPLARPTTQPFLTSDAHYLTASQSTTEIFTLKRQTFPDPQPTDRANG